MSSYSNNPTKMKKLILTIVLFPILIHQDMNMLNAELCSGCAGVQVHTKEYSIGSCLLTDSVSFELLQGCWGTDSETGNSVLCFTTTDSVLWVDPLLWCKYEIIKDSIIMTVDDLLYYHGRIKYRSDTLFLEDEIGLYFYPRQNDENGKLLYGTNDGSNAEYKGANSR